jgi:hypothetical protein
MFVGPVPAGQPVGAGAAGAVTRADGADSACAEPSPFFAVTRTRTVLPRSADFSVYVDLFAPPMLEQLPPFGPQRRHWYEKVIGVVPFHEPELAVSTEPTVAVPLIVGGDEFVGAASPAAVEKPATASTVTRPAASRARRDVVFFMVPLSELLARLPYPGVQPVRAV